MSTLDALARDSRALLQLPQIVVRRIMWIVRKPELGHCWEVREGWNSGNGYAKCNHKGKAWLVHRLAYYFAHNSLPSPREALLDHLCESRACIRPAHLEPVSTQINTARGKAVLFRKAS